MANLEIGSAVVCGICKKDTTVTQISEREGTTAYDLKCWHRNAICPKCGEMARDASDTVQQVVPHCEKCDGPFYEDDDDAEDESA